MLLSTVFLARNSSARRGRFVISQSLLPSPTLHYANTRGAVRTAPRSLVDRRVALRATRPRAFPNIHGARRDSAAQCGCAGVAHHAQKRTRKYALQIGRASCRERV